MRHSSCWSRVLQAGKVQSRRSEGRDDLVIEGVAAGYMSADGLSAEMLEGLGHPWATAAHSCDMRMALATVDLLVVLLLGLSPACVPRDVVGIYCLDFDGRLVSGGNRIPVT